MIPLLFLRPKWMKKNPILTLVIGLVFLSISVELFAWWKATKDNTRA